MKIIVKNKNLIKKLYFYLKKLYKLDIKKYLIVVPTRRIELLTSPLPMECSTTELRGLSQLNQLNKN